jgi:hypothetical protein
MLYTGEWPKYLLFGPITAFQPTEEDMFFSTGLGTVLMDGYFL